MNLNFEIIVNWFDFLFASELKKEIQKKKDKKTGH